MSVYPVSVEKQTPCENMENIINQSYVGYTFHHTVEQHLEEAVRAYTRAEERIYRFIENAKTDEEKAHWNEAMEWLRKEAIPEPHDCNINYKQYMASKLTMEELVADPTYDSLTITDINGLSKYIKQ